MSWTKSDKSTVRRILYNIAAETSQAEFARSLGDRSRATVNNWIRRGRVPVADIPAVIRRAREIGMDVHAGQLHPDARVIESMQPQTQEGT